MWLPALQTERLLNSLSLGPEGIGSLSLPIFRKIRKGFPIVQDTSGQSYLLIFIWADE